MGRFCGGFYGGEYGACACGWGGGVAVDAVLDACCGASVVISAVRNTCYGSGGVSRNSRGGGSYGGGYAGGGGAPVQYGGGTAEVQTEVGGASIDAYQAKWRAACDAKGAPSTTIATRAPQEDMPLAK